MSLMKRTVDSRESLQTKRYRWYEGASAFYVWDSERGGLRDMKCMGDMVDFFGDERGGSLIVGTQTFYDALNLYFDGCQEEIGDGYFGQS